MTPRAAEILGQDRATLYQRVDRLFAFLFLGQWLAAIVVALVRTPWILDAGVRGIHPHVWTAIFFGGAISSLPIVLIVSRPGAKETRYVNGVAQMLWSALLIHLTGGRVETHFHVFGSLALLSFYRDWRVLVPATLVVAADHFVRGLWFPESVYGLANPEWWRFVEHSLWVAFLDAFLIAASVRSERELREVAVRRAEAEGFNDELLRRVEERSTALAATERQLAASERMSSVGTLAAGVAHEINNPLAFILGNVEFAIKELRGPNPDTTEILTALEESKVGGNRVRDIVRDLKLFARPAIAEGGTTQVEQVLERAISMAANEIRHRAKMVRVYGGVPAVDGGESRVGQVFLNLLVNAAQAIPEGKADSNEIRVETRRSGDHVQIDISDTGCGIPVENRGKIFEPFFTTKPVGVGTGLGLSICHGIVTSLGGELTIAATEVGRGTTLRVSLPVSKSVPAEPLVEETEPGTSRTRDVLVIDDEPLVARSVRRVLSPHRVISETSGRAALLRLAAGERFDLVLCDVMMPEMSGPEVFAEMQRTAPDQAERVVFVTGGAFTDAAREFLAKVPNRTLEKPVNPADLKQIVESQPPLSLAARRRPTLTSLSF